MIAGTLARDLGGCLAADSKVTVVPGVEFIDRLDGLAAASSWRRPICKSGSTRGLRLGINPGSRPWADAAAGGAEAR